MLQLAAELSKLSRTLLATYDRSDKAQVDLFLRLNHGFFVCLLTSAN